MCQLFSLISSAPASASFSFSGFRARGGETGEHRDGFGLAFHSGGSCRVFIDDEAACSSALAQYLCDHQIPADVIVGHVRKATRGAVTLANCHPFVREWQGRYWSFVHNGNLDERFHPALSGRFLPAGQTDSELAFCLLMQKLAERFPGKRVPHWQEVAFELLPRISEIAACGTFNMLLSDGSALYAFASNRLSWLSRQHPFPVATLIDRHLSLDLAAANRPGDRMIVVATDPLTANESWETFAPGEFRVFVRGEAVFRTVLTAAGAPPASVQDGESRVEVSASLHTAFDLAPFSLKEAEDLCG